MISGDHELAYVSTGQLPSAEDVRRLVTEAHERFGSVSDGQNSQVYPALAHVPSDLFGICIVGTNGSVYAVGDADHEFSIMSVSKPFLFALICELIGRRGGAREAGCKRHGDAVQLAGGG